ncbi:MAG TPA: MFS transporter [Trueperaceae bacterium]|nr:MFS transporter [Trueperaceae bacterium]
MPPHRAARATFHGWRIAWALAVTQTVGFGVLFYAFQVFTLPMEAELGLSRAQTSGAYSLALLLSGLAAVPVGRWVDRRGARLLMTVASLAGAGLLLAWSRVTGPAGLYLVQAGIGLVMSAVLYDVAFTVLAVWFRRRRLAALLIVTLVAGLASTVFVPLSTWLVTWLGWREALRVLALVVLGTMVPLHALFLRDNPARLGVGPDGDPLEASGSAPPEPSLDVGEALRSAAFWWLATAFTFDRVASVAMAAHAVPLLLERGHDPALVATVVGLVGLMQLGGRLLFAPAARGRDLASLTAVTFAARAAALLLLVLPLPAYGLVAFAVLFGAANGAGTLARAALVAERFGSRHYGAINGSMSTLIALAQTVAPLSVGFLRVATGDYAVALLVLAGTAVVAALAVLKARPPRQPAAAGA